MSYIYVMGLISVIPASIIRLHGLRKQTVYLSGIRNTGGKLAKPNANLKQCIKMLVPAIIDNQQIRIK